MQFTVLLLTVILGFLESPAVGEAHIDINRVKLLADDQSRFHQPIHNQKQVTVDNNYKKRYANDHSSWRKSAQPNQLYQKTDKEYPKRTSSKVYSPRQDPRLFYQSDAYLEGLNVNYEVASVYPGKHVVRSGEQKLSYSSEDRMQNLLNYGDTTCITCPHDRTLIAKAGQDRVYMQAPRLVTCTGAKAPRNVHFLHMYGPRFNSVVELGSHMIVGKIASKDKTFQHCKLQVHVVSQGCHTPKYLLAKCGHRQETCNFTCRDEHEELLGNSALMCGKDMRWSGDLPVCRNRTWCKPPPPPDHGHLSCQGSTAEDRPALPEGSRCRVRCERGWHWSPRAVTVCRRGAWTHHLTCQLKRH